MMKDILDEKDKRLHNISKEVEFPLTDKDKNMIHDMIEYLHNSQLHELSEKYNLRPGMGLSAISNSMEEIYVQDGEGCLSVNRPVEGIIPRYARVTLEAYDEDGNKIQIRGREELAICFQHEIDHLNGILFVDKIDPKNPYKGKDQMRAI